MFRHMAGNHQQNQTLRDQLSSCVQEVCMWMQSHQLQLNTSKTAFIWCCPSRRRRHIPDGDFHVNADQIKPVSDACNLGVFVDGEMSMRSHISHVAAACFSAMRQISSIRRSLPSTAREMLITSLVHSRLDYCNVVFAGLPACDIRRLQSVLNSSIRLVNGSRKCDLYYVIATGCRLPDELSLNYTHSFIRVHRVMHHGTLLIMSKERRATCGHSHSGSAENSAIVWQQSFL